MGRLLARGISAVSKQTFSSPRTRLGRGFRRLEQNSTQRGASAQRWSKDHELPTELEAGSPISGGSSWFLDGAFFPHPHKADRPSALRAFSMSALVPFAWAPPSRLHHLLGPPSNTITLRIEFQYKKLGGGGCGAWKTKRKAGQDEGRRRQGRKHVRMRTQGQGLLTPSRLPQERPRGSGAQANRQYSRPAGAGGLQGPEAGSSQGDLLELSYQCVTCHVAFCDWLLDRTQCFQAGPGPSTGQHFTQFYSRVNVP